MSCGQKQYKGDLTVCGVARGQQVTGEQHLKLPGRHSVTSHGSICHLANKLPTKGDGRTLLCGPLTACGGRGPGRRATHWCPSDAQRLTLRLVRTRVAFPLAGSTAPACCAGDRRRSQGTVALCVCVCACACRAFTDTAYSSLGLVSTLTLVS